MIFIGLGSNQGNREAYLQSALDRLATQAVEIVRVSPWLETEPWGLTDQPAFLNGVCEVRFGGSAPELMQVLLDTEEALGRVRTQKWGPRTIDLDLLEFNREIHDTGFLTLPHPWYTGREFVLDPLADLEPGWVPTGHRHTVTKLLEALRNPQPVQP